MQYCGLSTKIQVTVYELQTCFQQFQSKNLQPYHVNTA